MKSFAKLMTIAVFFLSGFALTASEVIIPEGVRYKRTSVELNQKAEKSIGEFFGSFRTMASPTSFLGDAFLCGPFLWDQFKDDVRVKELSKTISPVSIPIFKDKKIEGFHFMKLRVVKNESDSKIFFNLLQDKLPLEKQFSIRRPNSDELGRYWALISWDIEEPIFVVDDGKNRILVNLIQDKKTGELKIFWIDDFSEGALKRKIGKFYKGSNPKEGLEEFLKEE